MDILPVVDGMGRVGVELGMAIMARMVAGAMTMAGVVAGTGIMDGMIDRHEMFSQPTEKTRAHPIAAANIYRSSSIKNE